jgi:hypothetical protein
MAVDYSTKIGTELIQRQALLVLYDKLNTTINSLSSGWTTADNTFWAALGRGTPAWTVETIDNINFYPGTVPSLMAAVAGLEAPDPEKYPNVSTFAHRGDPKRSSDDTGENFTITLAVEVMVKSFASEVEVNTRIQKTLEAVHSTLLENNTLYSSIIGLPSPSQSIGDVFVRLDPRDRTKRWYFQGGFLEYKLDKYVNYYTA